MRTPLAVLALSLLASCEKEPPPAAAASLPPEPPPTSSRFLPPPPPPEETTAELPAPVTEKCVPTQKRWKGIPVPPSVYPKKYMPWFETLCSEDQEKVTKFCTKHPTDWQTICGGIGPLHIAYPPYPRVRMYGDSEFPPHVVAIYRSTTAWEKALTPEQKAYIDVHCPGSEDQPSSDLCGDNTPLVIAFQSQPVEFVADGTHDWPTASTPWLVLDRDDNGTIDGEHELFGSSTILHDGYRSPNGFIALAELDDNHDGRIDAADPAFAKLQLWADANRDRQGSTDELTAAFTSIVSISLANHVDLRCDARRNCEGERATIVWRDDDGLHEGAVVDVYLPRR
jgi:hypothetical protein